MVVTGGLVGGAIYFGSHQATGAGGGSNPGGATITQSACGLNGYTSVFCRAPDMSASSTSYLAGTAYLVDPVSGAINPLVMGATLGTGGWTTLNASIPCGQDYKVVVTTTAGSIEGGESAVFSVNKLNPQEPVETHALAAGQIYFENEINAPYYTAYNNAEGSNSSTGFVDLNASIVLSTAGIATTTVGTDGSIEIHGTVRSGTANKFVVGPNQDLIICVNVGTSSHWQEPSVAWKGVKLSSAGVKSSLNEDDQNALSAYNYCYRAGKGGIDDVGGKFDFKVKARSGVNPADDPVIGFFGVGKYKSSKSDAIKEGIYTDASTQVLVVAGVAYTPTITIKVA
jgi:hypothetical protein